MKRYLHDLCNLALAVIVVGWSIAAQGQAPAPSFACCDLAEHSAVPCACVALTQKGIAEDVARQVREKEALRVTSMIRSSGDTANAKRVIAGMPSGAKPSRISAIHAAKDGAETIIQASDQIRNSPETQVLAPSTDCFFDCYDPYEFLTRPEAARQTQEVLNALACRLWTDCLFAAIGPPPPPPPPSDSGAQYGVLFDLPTKTDAVLKAAPFGFVAGDRVVTRFIVGEGFKWQVIRAGVPIPAGWGDGGTIK